jgi:hypothetical protein
MRSGTLLELPPPGLGVITLMGKLNAGLLMSDARIAAVSCVLLT